MFESIESRVLFAAQLPLSPLPEPAVDPNATRAVPVTLNAKPSDAGSQNEPERAASPVETSIRFSRVFAEGRFI